MKTEIDKNMQNDGLKGAIGVLATIASVTSSMVTTIEPWLRVLSLLGGIVVCCFTIWSIYKSNKRKDAQFKDKEDT